MEGQLKQACGEGRRQEAGAPRRMDLKIFLRVFLCEKEKYRDDLPQVRGIVRDRFLIVD